MNPWLAKAVILVAFIATILIRAPHGKRSRAVKVVTSRKGPMEVFLLTLAWIAFFLPIFWIATPWLAFADFPLYPFPLVAGSLLLALGLWLFYRSHADLGVNWSVTLEIRDSHRLVTTGIYRHIRHPMYSALLLYGLGQMMTAPNWIVGPSYFIAMILICALRLGPEEKLMKGHFSEEYEAYTSRTKRFIPGLW